MFGSMTSFWTHWGKSCSLFGGNPHQSWATFYKKFRIRYVHQYVSKQPHPQKCRNLQKYLAGLSAFSQNYKSCNSPKTERLPAISIFIDLFLLSLTLYHCMHHIATSRREEWQKNFYPTKKLHFRFPFTKCPNITWHLFWVSTAMHNCFNSSKSGML